MDFNIGIDTNEIIDALAGSASFHGWIDQKIDERTPPEYDLPADVTRDSQLDNFVLKDELASRMQEAFGEYDQQWFGIHGADSDRERIQEWLTSELLNLPLTHDARCPFGQAFEIAVLRVITNVLEGSLHTDPSLADALHRLDVASAGRPTAYPPEDPGPQSDRDQVPPGYGDRMGAGGMRDEDAEPWRTDTEAAMPRQASVGTRHRITVEINSVQTNDALCRLVTQRMQRLFGTNGNPSVTVEDARQPYTEF